MKHRIAGGLVVTVLFSTLLTVHAQITIQTLHAFSATAFNSAFIPTNSDGAVPYAAVIVASNTVYGTTHIGGTNDGGVVFRVNVSGGGFTNLHTFNGPDGFNANAGLVLSGNTLYGTTFNGGTNGYGVVFRVNTDGSGYTNLHNFAVTGYLGTNSEGINPQADLLLSGNTLFGTATGGGTGGGGTVFRVNTDGRSFTNLHSFLSGTGYNPLAGVILSGNTLYGTTEYGGSGYSGTLFKLNTDGSGYTNIYSFLGAPDGRSPQAGLVLSGNTLYGTTFEGGNAGNGCLFAINTDGSGYTKLYDFTAGDFTTNTNLDGIYPQAKLILAGTTLYGTASAGGTTTGGTIFAINTDGTDFTTLYDFTAADPGTGTNLDGVSPFAGVVLSGNTLYGTASSAGASGFGTVFALSLVPSLGIVRTGPQSVLSWPTWAPNFGVQFTTNLVSGTWSNLTSGITALGTNYVFTNSLNRPAAYFRLKQ